MLGVVFACGLGCLRPARKKTLTLAGVPKYPTAIHTGVWFFSSRGHHVEFTQWNSFAGAPQPLTLLSFINKQCVAFNLVPVLPNVWPVFCSSMLQVFFLRLMFRKCRKPPLCPPPPILGCSQATVTREEMWPWLCSEGGLCVFPPATECETFYCRHRSWTVFVCQRKL